MNLITINDSKRITVNSDKGSACQISLVVEKRTKANVIIFLEGKGELKLDLQVKVESDCQVSFLTVNHNEADIEFGEKYDVYADSKVTVAHMELSEHKAVYNSEYQLYEQGAELTVQTASVSESRKIFNQDTFHNAGNTTAHINNYGVVMAHGYTDMVVRNTIVQGAHNSSTHQTSRLLTYDKSAIGRILPVLYIYDDEVQASHAASLGQPDEEQIYYLQSRGLSLNEAIGLIVKGYLLPVTQILEDESLNKLLLDEIEKKVSQNA